MVPPPPSYDQVTRSPGLPPAAVDSSYPSNPSSPPVQWNHIQQTGDNRTIHTASAAMSTSPGLNKSGNSNWGIADVPFQMSPMLCQSASTTDFFVPDLQEVNWRQYDYDFQFDENVKRESEVALEDEDYVWQGTVS
ncbi:uncharacterized protein [Amphiura filiformis]|uniref:uncharacterized protein n=1 Tax=Amphiura filiformis TaxID=82378 RepID=UPI003B228478